jgi:lysozyme
LLVHQIPTISIEEGYMNVQAGGGTDSASDQSQNWVPGIDVSHFQGQVNWQQVAQAGIRFAFAKASEGTNNKDPQFAANWEGMRQNGILRGAYHFYRIAEDPVAQAENFLSCLPTKPLQPGDLPPVIDLEEQGDNSHIPGILQWLSTVQQAVGRQPIIYTATGFWTDAGQLATYPLWVANYGVSQPRLPQGWTVWSFWQYTDQGSVPGAPHVDRDWFNGHIDRLRLFAGYSS